MRISVRPMIARATALLALPFVLAACGEQVSTAAAGDVDLDGSWRLVQGRDAEGALQPGGRGVTLAVDGAAASGTSACNQYSARVQVDGTGIRFGEIGGTEMACEPAAMEIERRFLATLGGIEEAEVADGTLVLSGAQTKLTFHREAPVDDAALVGPTWVLESLIDGEAASSVLPGGELRFTEGGVLVGSSGCRRVHVTYEAHGDEVTVGALETGEPSAGACSAAAEAQHRHVVDVLRGGFAVTIDGDRLTLTSRDGLALGLRAR